MKILLTNDDGIEGEGLLTLASALKKRGHEVFVAAPTVNNSAISHKLTMRTSVSVEKRAEGVYSIGGSPADCVLIALFHLKFRPDLVISGINTGTNLGSDVLYSGTVAGAEEGAQNGYRSIALSARFRRIKTPEENSAILLRAAEIAADRLDEWYGLAGETDFLNINVPDCEPLGTRFCANAHTPYNTQYETTESGVRMILDSPTGTDDISLLRSGYLTITPMRLNRTDRDTLRKWEGKA